ncbi:DUF3040 domain-containing protein [Timonella senegalensis]|uniref:DUF3040 domain-containing protein n=1 Tax=Timonella senegalensis TaxID=1465825 RepID=UPI0028A5C801|nr:DUF3040 domain-containing protein [Timonella senegalensis]
MPLSEHEQRILEQLERDLSSQDPKLATTMTGGRGASMGRIVAGIVGVAIGILLLVIGVANSMAWVGVIGFAIMFLAVVFAASGSKKKHDLHVIPGDPRTGAPAAAKKHHRSGGSFMQRMEERWDNRSSGDA